MDFSFDIYEIYRQFCDITSRGICNDGEVCSPDDEIQKVSTTREALAQLLKVVETKISSRVSILEEVYTLMLRLDLMADFLEFKRFYDFVFFICRENGQKNITVSRAIMAWRLVLAGRFRLLNQWCNFVEKNQRHNISADTWRQVLAFSRCVHENLEGYDPEGAWPVLIDDFVEYMYRIMGTPGTPDIFCNCGDSESQQCEESLSGLKNFPGSKRKWGNNFQQMEVDSSDGYCSIANSKRRLPYLIENNENFKHSNNNNNNYNNQLSCSKSSPCAVEGCLSKGFAGLLSGRSCLQFNHDTRLSYT